MQTLKDLASAGHTVVVSIHQPRSSIFAMFDDVLLLTEGGCVYHGPAASALEYFSHQGFECPERYNPAEFLADLISVDYAAANSEKESRSVFHHPRHQHSGGMSDTALAAFIDRPSFWKVSEEHWLFLVIKGLLKGAAI